MYVCLFVIKNKFSENNVTAILIVVYFLKIQSAHPSIHAYPSSGSHSQGVRQACTHSVPANFHNILISRREQSTNVGDCNHPNTPTALTDKKPESNQTKHFFSVLHNLTILSCFSRSVLSGASTITMF